MKELIPESKKLIVESTKKTNYTTDHSKSQIYPKAVLWTSQEEFYQDPQDPQEQKDPLELIVQQRRIETESTDCSSEDLLSDQYWEVAQLPADLYGHVFIVGAVGYFGSEKHEESDYVVEPAKVRDNPKLSNSLINGEGMIYRLDFHQTPHNSEPEIGKAWMANRIVKTPDYYADLALWQNGEKNEYKEKWPDEYSKLQFANVYLTRASIKLGARNFLNTAFLPMRFSDGTERLLVTWDVGRPYEIDPRTLGLVGPIGWNFQWHPMIPFLQDISQEIFPVTLSSAHPVFDTHTDEMFTVNASKSFRNVFWLSRLLSFDAQEFSDRYLKLPFLKDVFQLLVKSLVQFLDSLIKILEKILNILGFKTKNAVYLKRWKGEGTSVEEWQVVRSNGRPLIIQQSLHQMGISKDYIILSDSSFKLVLADLIPSFSSKNLEIKNLEKFLSSIHEYLSYPQLPNTQIYIIPRNQLKPGVKTVKAKQVEIEPETAHFKVDYENPDGKIILHVAHTAATDPAEFLHPSDKSIYGKKVTEELKTLAGMFVGPMDVGRLGSWTIDVAKEKICQKVFVDDTPTIEHLWSIALYARQGFQPNQFTDIYWNCWGAWEELLSQPIFDLYKNYKHRRVPLKKGAWEKLLSRLVPFKKGKDNEEENLQDIVKKGKPANLLRMHIEREGNVPNKLTIQDIYNFPSGVLGNSPQFVPRLGTDDPNDGYIICTIIHSDNPLANKSEFWIFDTKNLNSGPCYRLSHPKLNIGATIHTTHLSKLETPPAREDYNVRCDYQESVEKTNSEAIKTLFEKDVYPHFKP